MAFNPSVLAAWWGAVISTSVLIWDVIKWKRNGPRLIASFFTTEAKSSLRVRLTNIGGLSASIADVTPYLFKYVNGRRRRWTFPFGTSYTITKLLPVMLQPGDTYTLQFFLPDNPMRHPQDGKPFFPITAFKLPSSGLKIAIEVTESHKRKPYFFPVSTNTFSP